jgi:hypothetical protein
MSASAACPSAQSSSENYIGRMIAPSPPNWLHITDFGVGPRLNRMRCDGL